MCFHCDAWCGQSGGQRRNGARGWRAENRARSSDRFYLDFAQGGGNGFFRGSAIGPSGGGGNVALTVEPFAKLCVRAADVFVEGVSAALLVATEIVAIARAGLPCRIAFASAMIRGSRLRVSRRCGGGCFTARRAIFARRRLTSDEHKRKQQECSERQR